MMQVIRKIIAGIGIVIVVISACGFLYPFVGNYLNKKNQSRIITDYVADVSNMSDAETEAALREADTYNRQFSHREDSVYLTGAEAKKYGSVLDNSMAGIMGYINIPKIRVDLAIYKGTEENVLQAGVSHLAASSLPVGGESTHTVLIGHSGMPESELFTNISKLKQGDRFVITVLDRILVYEVDSQETVLPEDAVFPIEEGRDLCTLVTCTPVGINSHRLLVHAHRVEDIDADTLTGDNTAKPLVFWIYIGGMGLILVSVTVIATLLAQEIVRTKRKNRKKCASGLTKVTRMIVQRGDTALKSLERSRLGR